MTVDGAMTDQDLVDAIQHQRATVVHFSHHAATRPDTVFPTDLINSIGNGGVWTLSCHVLWPDHRMDLVGSVGLILDIIASSQVVSVRSCDSGSWPLPDGSDQSLGVALSKRSFRDTFSITGAYNEWRVKGACVKGIFVANPDHIYVRKKKVVTGGPYQQEIVGPEPILLDDIQTIFPNHNIYTMGLDGLQLLRPKNGSPA